MGTEGSLAVSDAVALKLMEEALDAIFVIDAKSNILWHNKSALPLTGYSAEQLKTKNLANVIKKGSIRNIVTYLGDAAKGKATKGVNLVFVSADNKEKSCEVTFQPVEGSNIGIVAKDVTERELAEKKRAGQLAELEEQVFERTKKVKEIQRAAVLAIGNLAESVDKDTAGHLQRIQHYSKILAEEMSKNPKYVELLTPEYIEDIYELSPLHDLGKVGIRPEVLHKNGKLEGEDWKHMQSHTEIGANALKKASEMAGRESLFAIGEMIALFHHQKWDGTGYPAVEVEGATRPLKGDEIPLCARIVALADTYDALTAKRPYKDPFPHEVAKQVLLKEAGRQLDPELVSAFVAREKDFIQIKKRYPETELTERVFELSERDRARGTLIMARDMFLKQAQQQKQQQEEKK